MKDSFGTYDGRVPEPPYECPSCAALRARVALLEKVAEEIVDQCPYCQGNGFTVTTQTGMEHDRNCNGNCGEYGCPIPVPIQVQEQCQFCYNSRAALDASKEGTSAP